MMWKKEHTYVNDKTRSYHDVEERMYLWLMIRPGLIMMWKKECTYG